MIATTEITREIEFDAAHRVPSHSGKCRNLHGHRYKVAATLRGLVKGERGKSDDGMVADFGQIKAIMMEHVHDIYDHATLIGATDTVMTVVLSDLAAAIPGHRGIVLPLIPTVENLSRLIFRRLDEAFVDQFQDELTLVRVRVHETPTCYADFTRA